MRGWSRYTINLVAQLVRLGVRVYLYTDRELDPAHLAQLPLDGLTIRHSKALHYTVWEQCWLPHRIAKDNLDIFHCPVHFGLPQFTRTKCVLTIHDVIEEVYYRPRVNQVTRAQRITAFLSSMARRRADHIITVSEFSRDDIMRHYKIAPKRISAVYLAADDRFQNVSAADVARVRAHYQLPRRYLFYIGSLEPRKGMSFALEALAQLEHSDLHLVVVGGSAGDRAIFAQRAGSLKISDRIQLLDFVKDEDLPALYGGADGFVYPSDYEGFGLQLCEAMKVGCPVLASRASCLPEVLGTGGDTFSLSDPSELAAAMLRLELDAGYRADLKRRAQLRSQSFSWKQTAEKTLQIYEELLGASPVELASPAVYSK